MNFTYVLVFVLIIHYVSCQKFDLTDTSDMAIDVIPSEDALIDCVVKSIDNDNESKIKNNNNTSVTVLWKYVSNEKSTEKILTANRVRLTDDRRFSVLHNHGSDKWVLRIRGAEISDTGLYTCEVNTDPPVSVTRVVNVNYPTPQNLFFNQTMSFSQNVDHNFTECCVKESIPSLCYGYCTFKGLVSNTPKPHVVAICTQHVTSLLKCLSDGKDHLPCCLRQNIPRVCHATCVGRYTLTSALDHSTCMDHMTPILACIAEGVQILPPMPKDATADAISSKQIKVHWENLNNSNVETYQINVTEMHTFDPSTGEIRKNSKLLDDFQHANGDFKPIIYKLTPEKNEFIIEQLKPFTMYQIVMVSVNKHGTSLKTNPMRVVTHVNDPKPEKSDKTEKKKPEKEIQSSVPNLRQCCIDKGLDNEQCLNALCDPTKVEESSTYDITMCTLYTNITFSCMIPPETEFRECCEERGVSQFCQHFCRGIKQAKVDFRHYVCLHHVPAYSSCILERHGILPSEPRSLLVTSSHNDWALMKWEPPNNLPETVIRYHIHIRELDIDSDDGYIIESVANSPYLLDGLRPGGQYEVFVSAVNKYGTSRGSSRVIFTTTEPEKNEDVELEQSEAAVYNETACCQRAALPDICLPICNFHTKISDIYSFGPFCADHTTIRTIVRCTAGGRDHRPCCERKGIEPACLGICAGHLDRSPYVIVARCYSYSGKIVQCMAEGADTLPGVPEDFHATKVTKNSITLKWKPSDDDTRNARIVSYQIKYKKIMTEIPVNPIDDTDIKVLNISNSVTTAVVDNLQPATRYSIYIVAMNENGQSLPSLVLMINTKDVNEDDHHMVIKSQLGPPYNLEVIHQATDMLSFRWSPPLYLPPDAILFYTVHYKNLDPKFDPKIIEWTKVDTYSNIMDLSRLTPDTQYAIAVQSRTESGLKSVLSEVVIEWTDAATLVTISTPRLEPPGPVLEGSMMMVKCTATGSPIPTISLILNGKIVYREQTRIMKYKLDYIQRNLSSIACHASNGVSNDPSRPQIPVQSHIEVRVRFPPTIKVIDKVKTAAKYGPIQLLCEISGNPKPNVTWYRDLKSQIQIETNENVRITLIPHSSKASTWIGSLLFKRVTEADNGQYLCTAQNEYGKEIDTIGLNVESYNVTMRNTSVCCAQKGVSPECRSVCKYEIDFDGVFNKPQCFKELDKYMSCAADGSDHLECCKRRGVSRDCLYWCAGYRVAKPSLCLLSSVRDIISCFQEGNSVLPSPPTNVHVKEVLPDNSVIVVWDEPEKNPEAVQWYTVFWKEVGATELEADRTDHLSYEIKDLHPNSLYEFLIKASNFHGTSALTDPLVINVKQLRYDESRFGHILTNILIGTIVASSMAAVTTAIIFYSYKNRHLLQKFLTPPSTAGGTISFENQGYMNQDTVTLRDSLSPPSTSGRSDGNNNTRNNGLIEMT